jgi:uncharacterized membrane protein YgdD (TMEM256/DUF423 family)
MSTAWLLMPLLLLAAGFVAAARGIDVDHFMSWTLPIGMVLFSGALYAARLLLWAIAGLWALLSP